MYPQVLVRHAPNLLFYEAMEAQRVGDAVGARKIFERRTDDHPVAGCIRQPLDEVRQHRSARQARESRESRPAR